MTKFSHNPWDNCRGATYAACSALEDALRHPSLTVEILRDGRVLLDGDGRRPTLRAQTQRIRAQRIRPQARARYAVPVTALEEPARAPDHLVSDAVRDPLVVTDAVLAARRRPMSERLELALSWNAVAAELRAGLSAATGRANRGR